MLFFLIFFFLLEYLFVISSLFNTSYLEKNRVAQKPESPEIPGIWKKLKLGNFNKNHYHNLENLSILRF